MRTRRKDRNRSRCHPSTDFALVTSTRLSTMSSPSRSSTRVVDAAPAPAEPSSSSPLTALLTWRSILAAVAITGTTAALFAAVRRYRRSRVATITDDMPALESVDTPIGSTPRKKKLTVVAPRTWVEAEFGQLTTTFLETLGQQNHADGELEAQLRAALPQVMKFSTDARALAAHFLLATNSHYLTESRSEEEFNALMTSQLVDMQQAWSLLECPSASVDESRALDILRIQVAQCLKDATLMVQVFERMMQRQAEQLNEEELILLFTTAPLLGRWQQCVQLGDRLSAQLDLSDFHGAPMDYQILYELAKVEQAKGNVPISQLQWTNYMIIGQRIKLRTSECSDQTILDTLEAEFSQNGVRTWKILSPVDASRMVRCGALAQLRSFSPVPLALVGPMTDTRVYAQGYALLGDQQQQATPVSKQIETYDLSRVSFGELEGGDGSSDSSVPAGSLHWKGSYVMVQESVLGEDGRPRVDAPRLNVTFELEMTIVPLKA